MTDVGSSTVLHGVSRLPEPARTLLFLLKAFSSAEHLPGCLVC